MGMAVTEDDFDASVAANTLKNGTIIVGSMKNLEYIKISDISKVKTGKHGKAKVMVVGKNVKTSNKFETSFPGGAKVFVVEPKKKTVALIEIDEEEDCIYADPVHSIGTGEMQTLQMNEFDKNDIESIKKAFDET